MTQEYIKPTVRVIQDTMRPSAPVPIKMLPAEAFGTPTACTCNSCVSACEHRPGWFAPGEPEQAAALLDLSLPEFFARYLGVDWYEEGIAEGTFLLAPALVPYGAGDMYPSDPRGRCIFLDEHKRCRIHAAKPMECRLLSHLNSHDEALDTHHRVGKLWRGEGHQDQVADLLGRTPTVTDNSDEDFLYG